MFALVIIAWLVGVVMGWFLYPGLQKEYMYQERMRRVEFEVGEYIRK